MTRSSNQRVRAATLGPAEAAPNPQVVHPEVAITPPPDENAAASQQEDNAPHVSQPAEDPQPVADHQPTRQRKF